MADLKPTTKKTMQHVFAELGDKKLILVAANSTGPQKLQDSRYLITEVGLDHVVIKMLGEENLILPFASITSLKIERLQVTISYG